MLDFKPGVDFSPIPRLRGGCVGRQGNHFNEYAGLEADYSKYPDKQQTAHFLHAYLTESTCTTPVSNHSAAADL